MNKEQLEYIFDELLKTRDYLIFDADRTRSAFLLGSLACFVELLLLGYLDEKSEKKTKK